LVGPPEAWLEGEEEVVKPSLLLALAAGLALLSVCLHWIWMNSGFDGRMSIMAMGALVGAFLVVGAFATWNLPS
jgi:hypothetical protein